MLTKDRNELYDASQSLNRVLRIEYNLRNLKKKDRQIIESPSFVQNYGIFLISVVFKYFISIRSLQMKGGLGNFSLSKFLYGTLFYCMKWTKERFPKRCSMQQHQSTVVMLTLHHCITLHYLLAKL